MTDLSRRTALGLGAATLALSNSAFAQQLREVPIGLSSTSFATAPCLAAREMGLFQKRGINPKIVVLDSAAAAMGALVSRSISFVLAGPGELVTAQGHGQDVVLITTLYYGLSVSVTMSKAAVQKLGISPDAPAATRLKALDNVVIATPSAGSAVTAALRGAAKQQGATVRFTYMSQPAMIAAIETGAIQGFIASAPFWAIPITRGTGDLWISSAKREFPAEVSPSHAISVQAMREFAQNNRDLVALINAVFADFIKAMEERPAEVKAAVAKVYPDLDAKTLDLLFAAESLAWNRPALTAADMRHDIAFMKENGVPLPEIDKVDPATMIFK
jgi:ABC-type nitrate/sulfonate/bicarbonate transport system substrate-binding protein